MVCPIEPGRIGRLSAVQTRGDTSDEFKNAADTDDVRSESTTTKVLKQLKLHAKYIILLTGDKPEDTWLVNSRLCLPHPRRCPRSHTPPLNGS